MATCLHLLAIDSEYHDELVERAASHDASKFSEAERIPYIWLTEYFRCQQNGVSFCYPEGMESRVKDAIAHHEKNNRHHFAFHADPNDMTTVDMIEMVCDWTAISLEFNRDNGSAKVWANKTIGHRAKFDEHHSKIIYATIDRLDALIAQNGIAG